MARNKLGCLVRVARLYVLDELSMLAKDRRTPGECEVETPAHGSKHFAMLPPKLGGMAVIVLLVHYGMKGGVELTVPERVGEVVLFNQGLDAFEFSNVFDSRHADEPSRQGRLDQHSNLVDVSNKILVNRPNARSAIGNKGNKALPAQQLQSLAHGIGRGAVTSGEVGDHKPFVGGEPPFDDVFPDQLIERGALAGGPDRVDPFGWLCFESARIGQDCPQLIHGLLKYHARLAQTMYDFAG